MVVLIDYLTTVDASPRASLCLGEVLLVNLHAESSDGSITIKMAYLDRHRIGREPEQASYSPNVEVLLTPQSAKISNNCSDSSYGQKLRQIEVAFFF